MHERENKHNYEMGGEAFSVDFKIYQFMYAYVLVS